MNQIKTIPNLSAIVLTSVLGLILSGCARHMIVTEPNYLAPQQFQKAVEKSKTFKQCPEKQQLQAQIDRANKQVERFNGGHVIIGRVVLDGPGDVRDVISQMEILSDGYFASPTKDLIRPVGFRMHQYAPYDLQLRGTHGAFVDVGTIHMTPLKKSQLLNLKGRVILAGNNDSSSVILYMTVKNGPVNTPSNGTSPRPYWPEPIKIQANKEGFVEASGFSPIKYCCTITAPDYLQKDLSLEFKEGQTLDFDTVTLEKPKQIKLSYIVADHLPFELKNLQTTIIPAGTEWKPVETERCYGWDLEFTQDKGIVGMRAFYCPCYIWDLGPGRISEFVNVQHGQEQKQCCANLTAENQHVYLMHQESMKHWVLFRIDIEGEPAPQQQTASKCQMEGANTTSQIVNASQIRLNLTFCQINDTALNRIGFNQFSAIDPNTTAKIISLLSDPAVSRVLFAPSLTAADGRPMSMKIKSTFEFAATASIQPSGKILLNLSWNNSDPNGGSASISTTALLTPMRPLILSGHKFGDFTRLLIATAEILESAQAADKGSSPCRQVVCEPNQPSADAKDSDVVLSGM